MALSHAFPFGMATLVWRGMMSKTAWPLAKVFLIHPGDRSFVLNEKIEAIAVRDLPARRWLWRLRYGLKLWQELHNWLQAELPHVIPFYRELNGFGVVQNHPVHDSERFQ